MSSTPLEQQGKVMKPYTATKSRNAGRESWSVIFRHPARLDVSTGRPGRRVRRGLGTADEAEATRLIDQLNEILRTEELWDHAARATAAGRFDSRVIDIFYEGLEATRVDFSALRESLIPLPTAADGYRTVLLLGTTGAGKTTVVRQLLGTDPATERFPSTSTAKTTIADTELIVTDEKLYQAAVTFAPRDEVIDYLTENVSDAALAAFRGRKDDEITHRILDHVNQRFRFSYVLGRGSIVDDDNIVDEEIEDEFNDIDPDDYGQIDLGMTAQVVANAVTAVKAVVERHASAVLSDLEELDEDERVLAEYIEETLDTDLRQSDEFHDIVDSLIDEIEKRFASLEMGDLKRNRQGWPTTWSWESTDRAAFIKVVTRFSSNYAPLFGRLLTPLVNGIRVSGPFEQAWASKPVRLVLVDGEGLGHSPKSVATLSTHVATQLQQVDAVLLVDNAAQPMQAAPVAALKSIAVSGNATKLHLLFTHFDQVSGANLPTFSAARGARPGLGRKRAQVHRRRTRASRRAHPASTDRRGPILRRRHSGAPQPEEEDGCADSPAVRGSPEPARSSRAGSPQRAEPPCLRPHEPVTGRNRGSQGIPRPVARAAGPEYEPGCPVRSTGPG